jgi:hypothetical protein
MASTNRYCWLWFVVVLSAAGFIAEPAALAVHFARPCASRALLAIVFTPSRKQPRSLGLPSQDSPPDVNTESAAIPPLPPTFRPGTHLTDFLWGSPDYRPKGPPAPYSDHSPKKK